MLASLARSRSSGKCPTCISLPPSTSSRQRPPLHPSTPQSSGSQPLPGKETQQMSRRRARLLQRQDRRALLVRREAVRKAVAGAVKTTRALGESVEGSNVDDDASVDPHAVGTSHVIIQTLDADGTLKRFASTSRSTTPRSPNRRPRSTPGSSLTQPLPAKLSLPSRLPQTGIWASYPPTSRTSRARCVRPQVLLASNLTGSPYGLYS